MVVTEARGSRSDEGRDEGQNEQDKNWLLQAGRDELSSRYKALRGAEIIFKAKSSVTISSQDQPTSTSCREACYRLTVHVKLRTFNIRVTQCDVKSGMFLRSGNLTDGPQQS